MKKGDILAYRGKNSWISKLVKYFTKSIYSHVCIYLMDNIAIEADGFNGRIKYRNINDYKGNIDIYTCDFLTNEKRKAICKYAISQIGQKYDYGLIFVLFLRHFGIKFKYSDSRSDICSELVGDSYKSCGVVLSKKKYPNPQEIISSKLLKFDGSY